MAALNQEWRWRLDGRIRSGVHEKNIENTLRNEFEGWDVEVSPWAADSLDERAWLVVLRRRRSGKTAGGERERCLSALEKMAITVVKRHGRVEEILGEERALAQKTRQKAFLGSPRLSSAI